MSNRDDMYDEIYDIQNKQEINNRNFRVERMMKEIGTDDEMIRKLLEVIDKQYFRF